VCPTWKWVCHRVYGEFSVYGQMTKIKVVTSPSVNARRGGGKMGHTCVKGDIRFVSGCHRGWVTRHVYGRGLLQIRRALWLRGHQRSDHVGKGGEGQIYESRFPLKWGDVVWDSKVRISGNTGVWKTRRRRSGGQKLVTNFKELPPLTVPS